MSFSRNRGAIAISIWLASVLVFSLAYWCAWQSRPDSFIINKEFNLTPYEEMLSKLWDMPAGFMWKPSNTSTSAVALELDKFSKSVEGFDIEATSLQQKLQALEAEQENLELSAKLIYEEHSTKLWSNVEKYKQARLKVETESVELSTLTANKFDQINQQMPSAAAAIAAADANIELAKAKYTLAVRQAETGEYVLDNLREFSDPETSAKLEATELKLSAMRQKQIKISRALANIRIQALSHLETWHETRTARLGWIDFLYFSVGVSTTTTFGDIVPNSRVIRVIALSQLLFSTLLVGWIVSLINRPQNAP